MIRASMFRRQVWAAIVFSSLFAAGASLRAQDQTTDSWIGKKVITALNVQLRVGNEVVDERGIYHTFTVTRTENSWLWLESKDHPEVKGYALPTEVVPYEDAIDYYTRVIQANPQDAGAYSLRALHWRKDRKELDIALGDFNEAIRLRPDWMAFWMNRGTCWDAKKEYDKAIADYNETIRLDPKYAMAYNNRGAAWGMKKDYDKAIADYNEAIRLDPKLAMAHNNRGWASSLKKDYDKAIADYDEAIRLDPKDPNPYDGRAMISATCPDAKRRDGKKAVEWATKACELAEWKESLFVATLAAACAEVGDFAGAVKWQTKAIKLSSDDEQKTDFRARLKLYQEKKPFRDTDPKPYMTTT